MPRQIWRTLVQSEDRILRYTLDASPGFVRFQVIDLLPELDCRESLLEFPDVHKLLDEIQRAAAVEGDDEEALRRVLLTLPALGD